MTINREAMLAMVQAQVPSIRTQAQFDLFMTAFQALTSVFDSAYTGNSEQWAKAKEVLEKTIEMAPKLQDVVDRLQEIPEDERGQKSSDFVAPPKEFHEQDEQRQLLAELSLLSTPNELREWYKNQRSRIDKVVSRQYRDPLFDAIRAKQGDLAN